MNRIRKITCLILALCVFMAVSGFLPKKKMMITQYPIKVVDANKKLITIEKEPQRIVSVSPSITETIFALGQGKKLVGRTDYCDYPAAASKIASIGEIVNPSIEKIVELKPDLVIGTNLLNQDTIKKLEALNIKVLIIYGEESFNGVYDTISKVGRVINSYAKADALITSMKYKVEMVGAKTKNIKKPSVYYVVAYGKMGDYGATGDTFIGKMIEMAGGTNAAKDGAKWKYSIEKLVQKNPDILVCSKFFDTKKGIEATNGYNELKAVKNGKLLEIDDNLINKQGPRIADGLYALAKLIHPTLFK